MLKKLLKSTIAVAAAAAMALSSAAITTAAATEATMTITGALAEGGHSNNTYTAYQIMTATEIGDKLYSYQLADEKFAEFFKGQADFQLTGDNQIQVKENDAWVDLTTGDMGKTSTGKISALASALDDFLNKNDDLKAKVGTTLVNNSATLPIGYYLVTETITDQADKGLNDQQTNATGFIASRPLLVNLIENRNLTLKNNKVTLEKNIIEDDKAVKTNNVSIGDTVKYEVKSSIPSFKANVDKSKLVYNFTDTFSTGLTYDQDSLEVKVGDDNGMETITDYKSEYSNGILTISFGQDIILASQGKSVVLSYSATLNKNAKVNSTDGNPNNVTLEYNNNPHDENNVGYLHDEVKTFTYGFKLHKVDKNDDKKDMAGTTFVIKKADGTPLATYKFDENGNLSVKRDDDKEGTPIVKIDEGGYASISGLDAGTYEVEEEDALQGYSKIPAFKVVITDEGGDTPNGKGIITITNEKGAPVNLEDAESGEILKNDRGEEILTITSKGDGSIDLIARVVNTKGISLPETGAKSAMYSMMIGAILLLAGGLFYLISKKSSKKSAK